MELLLVFLTILAFSILIAVWFSMYHGKTVITEYYTNYTPEHNVICRGPDICENRVPCALWPKNNTSSTIKIKDGFPRLFPPHVSVTSGDKVEWINLGKPALLKLGKDTVKLATGQRYSRKFNIPGALQYYVDKDVGSIIIA